MVILVFNDTNSFFLVVIIGLQDSDDEDLENDIDQQIESMLAPKRIVKEIKAPLGTVPMMPNLLGSMFVWCSFQPFLY